MDSRGVDEAMRMEYFCQVVSQPILKDVKGLLEAHYLWVTFKEALLEAYGYKRPKGRGQSNFDQRVSSVKTHHTAMQAFLDFEHQFA